MANIHLAPISRSLFSLATKWAFAVAALAVALAILALIYLEFSFSLPWSNDVQPAGLVGDNDLKIKTLVYDFGVVKPGFIGEHRFQIANPSDNAWKLLSVNVSCSCTATESSSTTIAPGATESMVVKYTAGQRTSDESQSVLVTYSGPDDPQFRLVLKAKVREPITCSPREILVNTVVGEQPVQHHFMVHNFGNSDWKTLRIAGSKPWLRVSSTLLPKRQDIKGLGEPRQSWRVLLHVDKVPLSQRRDSALLTIAQPGLDGFDGNVHVQLNTIPLVRASPSKLFFGECKAGAVTSRSLRIVFNQQVAPDSSEFATVTSKGGAALAFQWKPVSKTVWELQATFDSNKAPRFIEGQIELSFHNSRLDKLQVPFSAIGSSISIGAEGI